MKSLTIDRIISNFMDASEYNSVIMSRNSIKFIIDKDCLLLEDLKFAFDNYIDVVHDGVYYKIKEYEIQPIPNYIDPTIWIKITLE